MNNKKIIIIGIAVLFAVACLTAVIYSFSNNNSVLSDYPINDTNVEQTTEPQTTKPNDLNLLTTFNDILETTKQSVSNLPTSTKVPSLTTNSYLPVSSTFVNCETQSTTQNSPSSQNTSTTTDKNNTTTTTPLSQNNKPTQPLLNIQDILSENQVVGFRYDAQNKFYYADDKDCWQRHAGYNELYDHMASGAGMFIDQLRIRFTYEGQDWMIESWKGQYGLFVGGEVGVYTAPEGTYKGNPGDVNHYNCADKEDWLPMEMSCYWAKNNSGNYRKIFTRNYEKYWWATGFVQGSLTKYTSPRTELKLKTRITFKSEEMANLFYNGLLSAGFSVSNNPNLMTNDSCYINGCDVYYFWHSIHQESFENYNP